MLRILNVMNGVERMAELLLVLEDEVPMVEGIWQHRLNSGQHGHRLFDRGHSLPFGLDSVQDGA